MRNHLIHSQIIEAGFSDKSPALAGQELLKKRYYEGLLPVLEEIFNSYGQPGNHIRINRLEVDLGQIPEDLPMDLLQSRLKEQLEDYFQARYPKTSPSVLTSNKEEPFPKNVDEKSQKTKSDWEQLLHFIQKGYFPWWSSELERPKSKILFTKALENSPLRLFQALKGLSFPQFERVISLCNVSQLKLLINQTEAGTFQRLVFFQKLIWKISTIEKPKSLKNLYWSLILEVLHVENSSRFHPKEQKSILALAKNKHLDQIQLVQLLGIFTQVLKSYSVSKSSENSSDIQFLKKESSLKSIASIKAKTHFEKVLINLLIKEIQWIEGQSIDPVKKEPLEIVKKKEEYPTIEQEDGPLIIQNGGLVLCAAFLPSFFKGQELIKNNAFVSIEAQQKGVIFLQNMLHHVEDFGEEDLILNKILCGMEPEEPMSHFPKLTPKDQKEIGLLLEGMVSYWQALKSSSGKTIAEGFFQREGLLKSIDSGYHLHIQRLAFDLLLDKLPWAISLIKLPWMKKTLTVEW